MCGISMSYCLLDVFYWTFHSKSEMNPNFEMTNSTLYTEYLEPRFGDKTIFHQYATDVKFLQIILDEAKRTESKVLKHVFFQLVYPDDNMESPFDLAMKSLSPKCIEIMLEMLMLSSDAPMSKYIRKHFGALFKLGIPNFEPFLDLCFFQHARNSRPISVPWESDDAQVVINYHTSYID
jgi:hypothetical protein